MNRKVAIKRLTASDLTLFEWHFRNRNAGNQKAINLNADVFTGILYPALPEVAKARDGRLPIDLYLYGPGLASEINLQRKIVKHGTYKNWRLDGEFIFNPGDDPLRFNLLEPDDFVIFEFIGETYPEVLKAVFIANSIPTDQSIHNACNKAIGDNRL